MHPTFLEVDFHAIDGGHFLVLELFGELGQDTVHIGRRRELYLVLRHEIGRIFLFQFGAFHLLFGQLRQEQSRANECIAAIVQLGINHASVAFAADNSTNFLHFFHHIHFAYSSGKVLLAMLLRHIS